MDSRDLIISTKYGDVQGRSDGEVDSWLGIPFAKAPVGELRFKRAVEPDSYEGVLDCGKMKAAPVQFGGGMFGRLLRVKNAVSEDCLYLNVWAPKTRSENEKLPVFVYIFGGACHNGDAALPENCPAAFAKDGIVAVNLNYRLGPLGFYDFSKYDSDFDSNCGLSDVIMALKWINENIEKFGGDPSNVTICGESAGGVIVYSLLAAPKARPYFSQAISMSGLPSNVVRWELQKVYVDKLLNELHIPFDNVKALKTISLKKMAKVTEKFFKGMHIGNPGMMLPAPVIDDLVTKHPEDAIRDGDINDKRVMLGTCKDEGTLFYFVKLGVRSLDEMREMLEINGYGDRYDDFLEYYGGNGERAAVVKLNTDKMFRVDNIRCAVDLSRFTDVYMYQFDYVSVLGAYTKLGATHSFDICPALSSHAAKKRIPFVGDNVIRSININKKMHASFKAFIKTGSPENEEVGSWPRFTAQKRETMCMNDECSLKENMHENMLKLWDGMTIYK